MEQDDPVVTELRKRLTPEQKLKTAGDLYLGARALKAAALRSFHPDWTEQQVQAEVKRVFLTART